MTATTREIAQEIYDMHRYGGKGLVAAIAAALEEREREGYLRGIEEASKEALGQREIYLYNMDQSDGPTRTQFAFAGVACRVISLKIQALAQKDVKP